MAEHNLLVERLVAVIGRAFYPDDYVVVLDTLLRERYLPDDEMGPRLHLRDTQVRKIIQHLQSEQLIRSESVLMEDGRFTDCWYIDYQHFVDVVRYRIHLITRRVEDEMKEQHNKMSFQCPTCGNQFAELDCQKFISKDYKFVCPHCCPGAMNKTIAEPSFTLQRLDNSAQLAAVTATMRKIEYQLGSSENEHDGVYELLQALKDKPLIRNAPSENRSHGIRASKITDNIMMQEIEYNISKSGKAPTKKRARSAGPSQSNQLTIFIEEERDEDDVSDEGPAGVAAQKARNIPVRDSSLPEFLRGSRVAGTEKLKAAIVETSNKQEETKAQGSTKPVEVDVENEETFWEDAGKDDEVDWES